MNGKKLYKSANQRMICGVCGGLAEYFSVDVTLIRLGLALLGLTGSGFLFYIIAAIIMPEDNNMNSDY
ncbi:MAG: PspC domain-containing protein [Eubacteriales bacterium]